MFQYVKSTLGLEVAWDGDQLLKVKLDNQYVNSTCGICGVYNGDRSDDLIAGESDLCATSSPITPGDNVSIIRRRFNGPILTFNKYDKALVYNNLTL